MIYQRPDKGSLKEWADQVGDDSFTWENMLPYFQKSVNRGHNPGMAGGAAYFLWH